MRDRSNHRHAVISLVLAVALPQCQRAQRIVHAATASDDEPSHTVGAPPAMAQPVMQQPMMQQPMMPQAVPSAGIGSPVYVADNGVNITDVPAPADAFARVGRPLGARFASLFVGGPYAQPVAATPTQSTSIVMKRAERGSNVSIALEAAGIAGGSLTASQSESSVVLAITRIEHELEFAPPTMQAPGGTYYIRKLKVGRAFYLSLTGRTETINAMVAGQHSNATLQTQLRTYSNELRVASLARGLQPATPITDAASVSFDNNAYVAAGNTSPILVDYWSIPGTVQAEARTYAVELRAVAERVGSDPFNQRPRWTLLARCARNELPAHPTVDDVDGRWFDGQANQGATLGQNQSSFARFNGAIADGEQLRCVFGAVHHGGMMGRTEFEHTELDWSPGQPTTLQTRLSGDNGHLSVLVTMRVRAL